MSLIRIIRCHLVVLLVLTGLLVNLTAAHGDMALPTAPLTTERPGPMGGIPCPHSAACTDCTTTGCTCVKATSAASRRLGTRPRPRLGTGIVVAVNPAVTSRRYAPTTAGLAIPTSPHNMVRTTVIQV